MKTLKLFCLAIMALPLLGNFSFATEHQLKMPPEYIAAKDRWSAAGLADYQFTIRQDCACLPEQPISVVVRDGKIVRAFYARSKIDIEARRMSRLATLSGLFRVVDDAYAASAAEVKFKANAQFGYLEYLYIDFNARVADEELTYYIFDFHHPSGQGRKSGGGILTP